MVRSLNEEEQDDKQLRQSFKERWTRTPSEKLTVQIRQEAGKYKAILDNAISADRIVKDKYGQHREGIELLSQSDVCIPGSIISNSYS